jgi:uncharacterized protein YdeI (YjbR/CyaY-like superfamily)
MTRMPAPRRFATPAAFRSWLKKHHASAMELVVRCQKTRAAAKGLRYARALDEALCFGWIDGIRRGLDEVSFSVRFTPRRPRSIWSRVNVRRVEALIAAGRMTKAGLAAFEARDERRTGRYSFERGAIELTSAFATRLRSNRAAWAYFGAQAPWYRRTCAFWVMSAKREETRARRLEILIGRSAKALAIPPLAGRAGVRRPVKPEEAST